MSQRALLPVAPAIPQEAHRRSVIGRDALPSNGISASQGENMQNVKVDLPGLHMAGSDQHYNAHFEVGPHGFSLYLAPNAEYPVLDVNGTEDQLDAVARGLQDALRVVSERQTTQESFQWSASGGV